MSEYDPDDYYHWSPPDIWGYRCCPDPASYWTHGVVDGDSYDLFVDLGYDNYTRARIRAVHIDTAEIWGNSSDAELDAARDHRDFARAWVEAARTEYGDWPLVLRTRGKHGSFDRWLGEVFTAGGDSLERAMIDAFGDGPHFRWGDLY